MPICCPVRANHLCTNLLPDDELGRLLRAGETVLFKGPSINWQNLEQQVENLGFGDSFCVSYLQGPNGEAAKVSPIRISKAA